MPCINWIRNRGSNVTRTTVSLGNPLPLAPCHQRDPPWKLSSLSRTLPATLANKANANANAIAKPYPNPNVNPHPNPNAKTVANPNPNQLHFSNPNPKFGRMVQRYPSIPLVYHPRFGTPV